MILFGKNPDENLVVVAEIGVNHEGDVLQAQQMIEALAESGVDAIKLQSYTADRYISKADEARFQRVSKFSLNEVEHDQLFAFASELGVNLFSSALSEDWVPYLATKSRVLKVASGDITFKPTIQAGTELFDQIIISTGASTVEEIDQAVGWVAEVSPVPLREKLVLFHCVSAYPAPAEEANLGAIRFMQKRYGVVVGFSSHFLEDYVPIAAVAAGASVIEVHVTDQKRDREFRDHALSVEIVHLPHLVKVMRSTYHSVRNQTKCIGATEQGFRINNRKNAFTKRAVAEGEAFSLNAVQFLRGENGLEYAEVANLLGYNFVRDLPAQTLLKSDLIKPNPALINQEP